MAATLTVRVARGAANTTDLAAVDGLLEAHLRAVNGDYVPILARSPVRRARDITLFYTPPVAGSTVNWLDALDEAFTIEFTYKAETLTVVRVYTPMVLKDCQLHQIGASVTSWELLFLYENPVDTSQ